jgi:hypothetical protein
MVSRLAEMLGRMIPQHMPTDRVMLVADGDTEQPVDEVSQVCHEKPPCASKPMASFATVVAAVAFVSCTVRTVFTVGRAVSLTVPSLEYKGYNGHQER